jgi:hypothetical protein
MITNELFAGCKLIPAIHETVNITVDGTLTDVFDRRLTLDDFNVRYGLAVTEVAVLVAIVYQDFNWAPVYWKYLRALRTIPGVSTPESIVLGIDAPVESLEYPGFFLIPYYSNYLITPYGRLLKRSNAQEMQSSEGSLGYYTYRMTDDSKKTQNQLRHRILCYTFKPYPANVEEMDVNHIDGIPGHDGLDNLEWATRSENMDHAYAMGLRDDNNPVQVRDINTNRVYIYPSCSAAARALNVTQVTISNRARGSGHRAYDGLQFRYFPNTEPWPEFEDTGGKFVVEFPDGTTKLCGGSEAARLAGLTRTSLLRMLRDGRQFGTTQNKITRV